MMRGEYSVIGGHYSDLEVGKYSIIGLSLLGGFFVIRADV